MSTSVPAAGTSPFSHLARNPSAAIAGKNASDDDDKKKKDEEEAAAKKKAEEDDKKKKDEEEAAAKKKAEEEEEEKKKDAKKKSKADDGDDDSDRDDDENPEARAARARERGRMRAIVLSEPGKLNPVAAMHLATGTSMSRRQAVEMLHALPAQAASAETPRADTLRDRMASEKTPEVGAGDARPAPNLAEQIVLADKKRRGEA